ncbi:MAG: NAD(+)--dinitrogen-reductase ADP-D-ribosyltransferase [Candidatus Thiodiazotropha lotti]|uniref:NAD(+)--dinitrogen-reductase ADP-D-ribosyltransferase n=1 Tax=Candidatus Thiodiazotropha endoloripes TaxID=1818881 RepID=A0A1E2USV2_9GAMM|nr:NAD(+)--dinitrogen-reductase ADP-D-ribosyltransferase [Candidatus Thiodiazotropha endoloripes]MCG7899709.1 NAD(+)--dinitrogen-reductase ADP-D-ribosyltransferase [Candidatus Thiodiazotropha weberae]MCG7990704.1 NAD(+)--dinitrogen-reductase ADP-D-ribosyltransferase [Candidatus Thiodiazotropha lotti]MCG7901344.1 NAD(+)--dinitrogen-reductase ADP-D-ribosyltransferase [Candidatus Thiodiazotropha weberae]MCG7999431.1 NAD(+)--dinitrogen-reductase ADP-D-ribosyltransferase [Candidatus Thiodiazotropha 
MDEYKQSATSGSSLPGYARLPINRCNLPAVILGSLTFQQHPVRLFLDGVAELHVDLFNHLQQVPEREQRAIHFMDYMRSGFLLDNLDEAGFSEKPQHRFKRDKADYLRVLRGWMFDADGKEAAVMKSWVESRFGLLPRNHQGSLGDYTTEHYQTYLMDRANGLYNTNGLEAQLDLLYTYCQYEVDKQFPEQTHLTLYRGINQIKEHEILHQFNKREYVILLNNLNSFTSQRERADEFGDYILQAKIPLVKLLYLPDLLPHRLKGENEYLVIGGVYKVNLSIL